MTDDRRNAAGQAVAAGLLIPLLCLPLLAAAVPAGGFVAWRLLAAVTHRPVYAVVTFDAPGGLESGAQLVGALTVGIMAGLLVGVTAVRILFRGAAPQVLFRVGAIASCGTAAALCWWLGSAQVAAAIVASLGVLVGLRFACGYTGMARQARRARALPDRARLGLPPLGDDGQVRPAGPWDAPRG